MYTAIVLTVFVVLATIAVTTTVLNRRDRPRPEAPRCQERFTSYPNARAFIVRGGGFLEASRATGIALGDPWPGDDSLVATEITSSPDPMCGPRDLCLWHVTAQYSPRVPPDPLCVLNTFDAEGEQWQIARPGGVSADINSDCVRVTRIIRAMKMGHKPVPLPEGWTVTRVRDLEPR